MEILIFDVEQQERTSLHTACSIKRIGQQYNQPTRGPEDHYHNTLP